MSLYDLSMEFKGLLKMAEVEAENADQNEEQVLLDMLSEKGMEMDAKCDNIISYIKQLKIESDALKAEAKELKLRADSKAKRIESLKGYLALAEITKYESTAGKISMRKSVATVIEDESLIPAHYTNEKVTVTADKTMIKKAIQSGIDVAGAHLENRESVVVK